MHRRRQRCTSLASFDYGAVQRFAQPDVGAALASAHRRLVLATDLRNDADSRHAPRTMRESL